MKIRMTKDKIAVRKFGKPSSKKDSFGLVGIEAAESHGEIRYIPESNSLEGDEGLGFEVGEKVYFGNKYQMVRMGGEELLVMEADNIIAVVEDDDEQQSN